MGRKYTHLQKTDSNFELKHCWGMNAFMDGTHSPGQHTWQPSCGALLLWNCPAGGGSKRGSAACTVSNAWTCFQQGLSWISRAGLSWVHLCDVRGHGNRADGQIRIWIPSQARLTDVRLILRFWGELFLQLLPRRSCHICWFVFLTVTTII